MALSKKKSAQKKAVRAASQGPKKKTAAKSVSKKKAASAARAPQKPKKQTSSTAKTKAAPAKASTGKKKASTPSKKASAAPKMKSTAKTATAKKPKAAATKKSAAAGKSHEAAKKTTAPKKPPSRGPASAKQSVPSVLIVGGIEPYHEKPGEEYMNDDQVAHFRNILGTWRQELMEEVDRTVHNMQKEAANFPDPNDRATQESEFTMELRARDRERKLIKKIDESLAALEASDYGYCELCGVEIGIRRLEARPTATLCIDCKTLDEIRERRVGE